MQCAHGPQYARRTGHKEMLIGKGNNIFQGGNWQHLHAMLGLRSGDKVSNSMNRHSRLHLMIRLYPCQVLTLAECQPEYNARNTTAVYIYSRCFLLVITCLLILRDQNDTLDGALAWLYLNLRVNFQCYTKIKIRRLNWTNCEFCRCVCRRHFRDWIAVDSCTRM